MRFIVGTAIAVIVVFGAVLWSHSDDPPPEQPPATPPEAVGLPPTAVPATPIAPASNPPAVPTPAAVKPPGAPDYRKLFQQPTDMLPVMQELHARAKEGDAASQYWLHYALDVCDAPRFGVMAWNNDEQRQRTLEEALEEYGRNGKDAAEHRERLLKCYPFYVSGPAKLGSSAQWLEAAANGKYPLAQAKQAGVVVRRAAGDKGAEAEAKTRDALKLGVEALRSGDPDVILEASYISLYLADPQKRGDARVERATRSWQLAACQRGADCSPQAPWVKAMCRDDPQCQPYESGTDLIRRRFSSDIAAIELRAREINQLIDANRWEDIEFR